MLAYSFAVHTDHLFHQIHKSFGNKKQQQQLSSKWKIMQWKIQICEMRERVRE